MAVTQELQRKSMCMVSGSEADGIVLISLHLFSFHCRHQCFPIHLFFLEQRCAERRLNKRPMRKLYVGHNKPIYDVDQAYIM